MVKLPEIIRKQTSIVQIGNVQIGGGLPVVVQSMTNTDTANAITTAKQITELAKAGSEMVRITVDRPEAAAAVPKIFEILAKNNIDIPIIGDFHYNGHRLLTDYPKTAQLLAKYRINPGNVGFGDKQDKQFADIINIAIKNDKPVRIGVNWGSLDQKLLADMMDANLASTNPKDADEILREALVSSAVLSSKRAEELGMKADKIVVSCKVSRVQDLIAVYKELSEKCDYALHLGLTEAGMGTKGIVATTGALSSLLQMGIGDTIRASLTPLPGKARVEEVEVCKEVLQSLGLRNFSPEVSSCPGCGRTTSDYFQRLSLEINNYLKGQMPVWKDKYKGVEGMKVAVMGCIVNGPGESKHANIGISLPGTGESPAAPVFIDGKKAKTLKGADIADQFKEVVNDYVEQNYS